MWAAMLIEWKSHLSAAFDSFWLQIGTLQIYYSESHQRTFMESTAGVTGELEFQQSLLAHGMPRRRRASHQARLLVGFPRFVNPTFTYMDILSPALFYMCLRQALYNLYINRRYEYLPRFLWYTHRPQRLLCRLPNCCLPKTTKVHSTEVKANVDVGLPAVSHIGLPAHRLTVSRLFTEPAHLQRQLARFPSGDWPRPSTQL